MFVSRLGNHAGFYSMFFFFLNNYLYCKKHNISHQLDSSEWLFKHCDGWTDYFQHFFIEREISTSTPMQLHHFNIVEEFTLREYRDSIRDIYQYNHKTMDSIQQCKDRLGLLSGEYDAIFIRRGDKLYNESLYFPTEIYIEKLLHIRPECHTIFLQTDDYNCYLDLQKYIESRSLNIQVLTLCDPNTKGMMIFNTISTEDLASSAIKNKFTENNEYLPKVLNDLHKIKPVNEMNHEEIYKHTMEMLIGIDIVANSHTCVLDYFSNVSRFIKFFHNTYDNVYDIYRYDNELDLSIEKCPSFLCSFYPGL